MHSTKPELPSEFRQAIAMMAYQFLAQSQLNRAHTLYSLLVFTDTSDQRASLALGYTELERGKPKEALAAWRAIAEPSPVLEMLRARAAYMLEAGSAGQEPPKPAA